ncbi:MAG: hypothetical protein ACRDTE_12410, partial [Pseudonocardiaceae bacterium]
HPSPPQHDQRRNTPARHSPATRNTDPPAILPLSSPHQGWGDFTVLAYWLRVAVVTDGGRSARGRRCDRA